MTEDGKITRIIKNLLGNRRFYVELQGKCSRWRNQKNGLPQGSVLGPILFIYYINDMPDVTDQELKIFADDTKGSNEIEINEDVLKLQKCIDDRMD